MSTPTHDGSAVTQTDRVVIWRYASMIIESKSLQQKRELAKLASGFGPRLRRLASVTVSALASAQLTTSLMRN